MSWSQGALNNRTHHAPGIGAIFPETESICQDADRPYKSQYVQSLTIQRERRLSKLRNELLSKQQEEAHSPLQVQASFLPQAMHRYAISSAGSSGCLALASYSGDFRRVRRNQRRPGSLHW
jgi:hypothetical protein